ncbi:MAG: kynureninase [Ignavibacteria bacterium]|nr:kynureninase [Ignavibacteria bacterium]
MTNSDNSAHKPCFEALDNSDDLKAFREKFLIPKSADGKDVIYFAGNSLGLQPKSVRTYIEQELKDWEQYAVEGHTKAKNPWMPYHEFLTPQTAMIVGALPEEVVNMNTLTANLHFTFVSFYRPKGIRKKILIEAMAFPSDYYAVESQIRYHGFDPAECIIEVKPRANESSIRTEDIESMIEDHCDEIALIWLGGINYYTGQAFEFEKLTKAAHDKGITIGFDLAHAAGNLELELHNWNVDFAVWCNYKYLNGGPGAIGGCFVHEKHLRDESLPKFLGWWGHDKKKRFLMEHKYIPIPTVESWQVSNPPVFQLASLKASLDIFAEAGIENLRSKSEGLTGYLEHLIESVHSENVEIITPNDPQQRGCQLSLRIKKSGKSLYNELMSRNVICDWREPDVIRVAPVPLYNSFEDVYNFSEIIKEVLN